VKNTTQRIVAKALGAMKNYHEYDDFGQPGHTKNGAYPLRANYEEGYDLSLTDDGYVAFRISTKPYKHVMGVLEGATPISTFSQPRSLVMSGRSGQQKPYSIMAPLSCTSPLPISSKPSATNRTLRR
jgi:hypothetical protein